MYREMRLKKDIIIPAGTILHSAPVKTEKAGDDHFECVIGLSKDSCGYFTYCIDDSALEEYFEEIEKFYSLTIKPSVDIEHRHKITDLLQELGYNVYGQGQRTDWSACDISFEKRKK